MALIERLMKDPSEPPERWLPINDLSAMCQEVIGGRLTAAEAAAALQMTPADLGDWHALLGLLPPADQVAERLLFAEGLRAVLLLAERRRYVGYDTPDAVRRKLGI